MALVKLGVCKGWAEEDVDATVTTEGVREAVGQKGYLTALGTQTGVCGGHGRPE
jgi:hypothetical protein